MERVTRFGQVSIHGFRRLSDVTLSLRPLSVMIGANGTGKTSVLDVLSLLASSAQGRLTSSLSELAGLANVLTYDRAEELGLGITMEAPGDEPVDYRLWLRKEGFAHTIYEETLNQRVAPYPEPLFLINSHGRKVEYYDPEKSKIVVPSWEHNPLETSLSQVPKTFRDLEEFS